MGLAVETYRMKRLLNFSETRTLLIQQKITEKVGLYTVTVKPGFHYTTNVTTTTQKQSDYKVEQSSFTPIALF